MLPNGCSLLEVVVATPELEERVSVELRRVD